MNKTLTISIAAYRVEKYLAECLDSFTDPRIACDLEVLVINDGSGDGIRDIAREYEKRYPEVFRLIEKENGGHGSTINRGISEAKGNYFKTVDGDDLVRPKGLYELVSYLRTAEADLVVTDFESFDNETGQVLQEMGTDFTGKKNRQCYSFDEISRYVYVNMHAAAFRTDILKGMGRQLDEHCFYVDAEYMMYPVPGVDTVVFLEQPVYRYRLGRDEQSMNIRNMQKNMAHHERVLTHLLEFYREEQARMTGAKRAYVAKGIARIAVSQIKIYLSYPADRTWKRKLRELEERLKQDYPAVYHSMSNPAVRLLRCTGYVLYPAASWLCRRAYKI